MIGAIVLTHVYRPQLKDKILINKIQHTLKIELN